MTALNHLKSTIFLLLFSILIFNVSSTNNCTSLVPNCLKCNATDCTQCADNFYYSTFRDYSNNTKKLCANQICQPFYGRNESSNYTTCKACTISNCSQCAYNSTGTQTCLLCARDTYLSSNTCQNKSSNINFTYYVNQAPYLASNVTSASQLNRSGTFAQPYYFLQQALISSELNSTKYLNVTTTIYLMKGSHFFFQCDSQSYTSNSNDNTSLLYNYCGNTSFTNISTYYFKNDNNKIYIKALTCDIAAAIGLTGYTSYCVDLTTDSKPILYINSPRYYFNITSFAYFENIKFSGVNAFSSLDSNPHAYFRYFPVQLCSMESTVDDRYGQMTFSTTLTEDEIGFTYTCSDPFYAGSTIPASSTINTKCLYDSSYRQSLGKCSGEVYNESYFDSYTYDYAVDSGSVYYEDRRKVLFNIYAFSDFYSTNTSAPTLILNSCDFEYFLYDYEALIYVETYNMYMNTQPADTNITKNPYVFYTYTGNDRGVNLNITDSTFKYSRFCKGAIVYRKPQQQPTEFTYIFNFTLQFSKNWNSSSIGSQIFIINSTFNYMNYMTNLTAISYLNEPSLSRPSLPMYSGVPSQTEIYYNVFFDMGIILNLENFTGPIEISGCNINNNAHFIPEILPYAQSNQEHFSIDYFENSTTNEMYFSACNDETGFNQYFFQNGIDTTTDIDYLTTILERYSTLQISKNKGIVIVKDTVFKQNIGIFGGVISFYSPNFENNTNSYIVIENCTFLNNMAYLSGGSVFINPTIRQSEIAQICAGVSIQNSYFYQNMGMVKATGGAVSIICQVVSSYITTFTGSSKINKSNMTNSTYLSDAYTLVELFADNKTNFTDFVDPSYLHIIYSEAVYISGNIFDENYVGQKGSAVYITYANQVIVNNTIFSNNGPMFVDTELVISPYYVMFSPNSIIYQDETGLCFTEFDFFFQCSSANTQIPLSSVQGALHINFCSEYICVNANNTQNALVTNSIFRFNDVGPYLTPQQAGVWATALYLNGGFNNTLSNNTFYSHFGNWEFEVHRQIPNMYWFMPENYYNLSHAPVIRIIIEPLNLLAEAAYLTDFYANTFYDNQNNQITGMSGSFQYYGSLIYYTSNVQSSSVVQTYFNMTYNVLYNNMFLGDETALIYILNAHLNLTSNTFTDNGYVSRNQTSNDPTDIQKFNYKFNNYSFQYAQHHGMFWLEAAYQFDTYHYIYNNSFAYCAGREGVVFYFDLVNQTILLSKNNYSYIFALESGSYMSATSTITLSTIHLLGEYISHSYCGQNGALYSFNTNTNLMNFIINQTTFENCFANFGSAIFVYQTAKILCYEDNFIRTVYSNETLQVYNELNANIYDLPGFIDNDTLGYLTNYYSGAGQIYLRVSNNSAAVKFWNQLIQSSSYPYLNYNEFIGCYFNQLINQFGSVIYSRGSYVRFYQSDARNTSQGVYSSITDFGSIYVTETSVLITENIPFVNNSANYDGTTLYIKASTANITNCNFSHNVGQGQGTVYLYYRSLMYLTSSIFQFNYAYDSSAIFGIKNFGIIQNIENITFVNNTSVLNLVNLDYSNFTMTSCTFFDNIALYVTHGFSLSNSYLSLINCTVNYTIGSFLEQNDYQAFAGFLNMIYGSSINITGGTKIINCRGSEAAVVYALTNSIITITEGVVFQGCQSNIGPVISIRETQSVYIDSVYFIGNSLIDIALQSVIFYMSNSAFDYGDQQYISAIDSQVTLINVTMQNILNQQGVGSGMSCDCEFIYLEDCTFTNLTGVQGGALYLNLGGTGVTSNIVSSTFSNNLAQVGGAIYINKVDYMNIISSTFTNNVAIYNAAIPNSLALQQGMGGAIFFTSLDLSQACQLTLVDGNIFSNNIASHQGGAIIWLQYKFLESGTATVYSNNYATYGPSIASYPKELSMSLVSTTEYSSRLLRNLQSANSSAGSNSTNWTIASGNGFYFTITIIDQDGLQYSIDNQSVANIVSINKTQNISLENAQAVAQQGVFTFKNIDVTVVPGQNITLYVQISGLQSYATNIPFINEPQAMDFYVRYCVPGEAYTEEDQCLTCPVNYYLFEVTNNYTTCKVCDVNAKCYYGAVVTPLKGYWRSSIYSENFIKCPNSATCIGGNQDNPLGRCETGYAGILCGQCAANYSLVNDFVCTECPKTGANIVKLIVFYAFGVILTIILVYGSVSNVSEEMSKFQVYLKILITHFQQISIITTINFSWSNIMISLVGNQQGVGSILIQFFSVNCLISAANLSFKVFYQKMVIILLMPILLCTVGWLSVLTYVKVTKSEIKMRDVNICVAVMILFLIYPDLCITAFESLNCVMVDTELRLIQDLSIVCFTGTHLYVVLIITLPALIIWVIGIPLFFLFQFLKQKQYFVKLDEVHKEFNATTFFQRQCKLRFGFLANGLQKDKYYWYEIVVFYRKTIIVIVTTFFQVISSDIQVLLCLLVLVLSFFLQIILQPYSTATYNKLESISLIVCSITLYAGLFFIQNDLYAIYDASYLSIFFFVCIIIPNLCLFIYWIILIRVEALIFIFPRSKFLFNIISCYLVKRKDFQEQYFPDPDTLRKEMRKKEEKERHLRQAATEANLDGQKPLKSQVGAVKHFGRDEKKEGEDDSSQVEEKKENSQDIANINTVLDKLFQKPQEPDLKSMFDGITDHKQIVLDFQDIQNSYNVTLEDDEEKSKLYHTRRMHKDQDEKPGEERKSNEEDEQIETDHEKQVLIDQVKPRATINSLNHSFLNNNGKEQAEDPSKYGMTFGSGEKRKKAQQQREIQAKELEDKSRSMILNEEQVKQLQLSEKKRKAQLAQQHREIQAKEMEDKSRSVLDVDETKELQLTDKIKKSQQLREMKSKEDKSKLLNEDQSKDLQVKSKPQGKRFERFI